MHTLDLPFLGTWITVASFTRGAPWTVSVLPYNILKVESDTFFRYSMLGELFDEFEYNLERVNGNFDISYSTGSLRLMPNKSGFLLDDGATQWTYVRLPHSQRVTNLEISRKNWSEEASDETVTFLDSPLQSNFIKHLNLKKAITPTKHLSAWKLLEFEDTAILQIMPMILGLPQLNDVKLLQF